MKPDAKPEIAGSPDHQPTPFRFYDNRQKYLAFVNTCNEKSAVAAARGARTEAHPGDAARAARFRRGHGRCHRALEADASAHHQAPTVPLLVVAKEISLEDVRLGLDKMPDRFSRASADGARDHQPELLGSAAPDAARHPRGRRAQLERGAPDRQHVARIRRTDRGTCVPARAGWQTKPSPKTGNPVNVRPSVLVIYRADHEFLLDRVIPKPGQTFENYDLIVASQPWRARISAEFKASRILAPLARSLAPNGRLLVIQSYGRDPALEIIQRLWPDEEPFKVDRHELLAALKTELGRDAREFTLTAPARREIHLPLRDAHAAERNRRPHRHLDAVRRLECRDLRQPDRGRAPGRRRHPRRVPRGDAVRSAEARRRCGSTTRLSS